MNFECSMETENGIEAWSGCIISLINHGSHYEMRIQSRSGIMVLFGETRLGYFACIPEWGAGCHLVHPSDIFWNTEQLINAMDNKVDAITVACALKAIAPKIKIQKKTVRFY